MKIENMAKQLEKLGLAYSVETFGSNYFRNEKISFPGLLVTFTFPDDNGKEVKVKKYAERYGFTFKPWGGFPGVHWVQILRAGDAEELRLYTEYQEKAVAACEKYIHARKTLYNYSDAEFNEFLGGVMDAWEGFYQDEKREVKTA